MSTRRLFAVVLCLILGVALSVRWYLATGPAPSEAAGQGRGWPAIDHTGGLAGEAEGVEVPGAPAAREVRAARPASAPAPTVIPAPPVLHHRAHGDESARSNPPVRDAASS